MSPPAHNISFSSLDDALELWDRRKQNELMTRFAREAIAAPRASSVVSFVEPIVFDQCCSDNL